MSNDLQLFLDQYSQVQTFFKDCQSQIQSLPQIFDHLHLLTQYLTFATQLIDIHLQSLPLDVEFKQPLFTLNQMIEEMNQFIFHFISFPSLSNQQLIESQDKFFWITLTSSSTDGPESYISERLIKNFHQMAPPAYRAKAKAFVVSPDLTLYGLIRFDHQASYRISLKSSHLRNDIRSKTTAILHSHPFTIINLTKYQSKHYLTSISDIFDKYQFMKQFGSIIGSDFSQMIQPD